MKLKISETEENKLKVDNSGLQTKKYLYIKTQNWGDYSESITEIDEETLDKINPFIQVLIKNKGVFIIRESENKLKDIYKDFYFMSHPTESLEIFLDYLPNGDINSICEIKILNVLSEQTIYE